MRELDLVEQESLEKLKSFWSQYGLIIIACIVTFVVVYSGTKYWAYHKKDLASQAAYIYETYLEKVSSGDRGAAKVLAQRIIDEFKNTPYSALSALQEAKELYNLPDKSGVDEAISRLQWVIANSDEAWVRDNARLQLLQVLLDKKDYPQMVTITGAVETAGMSLAILELKGDALAKLGKIEEAKTAYQQSIKVENELMAKIGQSLRNNPLIQMKIDSLPR